MAMTFGALYDALRIAEVPEREARAAVDEVAQSSVDHRLEFANIRTEFANMKTEFAKLGGEVTSVKWMLGTMITIQIAFTGIVLTVVGLAVNHIVFK